MLIAPIIAQLIKGQNRAQGEQLALISRHGVRTECTDAWLVRSVATAEQIAGNILIPRKVLQPLQALRRVVLQPLR